MARRVYSPVFMRAGAVTWKRAERDSSSCENAMGTVSGAVAIDRGQLYRRLRRGGWRSFGRAASCASAGTAETG